MKKRCQLKIHRLFCHLLTFSLLLEAAAPALSVGATGPTTDSNSIVTFSTPPEKVTAPDGSQGPLTIEVSSGSFEGPHVAATAGLAIEHMLTEHPMASDATLTVITPSFPEVEGNPVAEVVVSHLIATRPSTKIVSAVQKLPRGWLAKIKAKGQAWYAKERNHRFSVAMTQLVYQGLVVGATLLCGEDIPGYSLAIMALLEGGIEAAFVFKNSNWRDTLLGSKLSRKLFNFEDGKVPGWAKQTEAFVIWSLVNASITGVIIAAMWKLGIPIDGADTIPKAFLFTLLWDIGREYTWDLAVNTFNLRLKERYPARQHEAIDRLTTGVLGILSGVGAAASIAQLCHLPIENVITWTMTVTGTAVALGAISIREGETPALGWDQREKRSIWRRCASFVLGEAHPAVAE